MNPVDAASVILAAGAALGMLGASVYAVVASRPDDGPHVAHGARAGWVVRRRSRSCFSSPPRRACRGSRSCSATFGGDRPSRVGTAVRAARSTTASAVSSPTSRSCGRSPRRGRWLADWLVGGLVLVGATLAGPARGHRARDPRPRDGRGRCDPHLGAARARRGARRGGRRRGHRPRPGARRGLCVLRRGGVRRRPQLRRARRWRPACHRTRPARASSGTLSAQGSASWSSCPG